MADRPYIESPSRHRYRGRHPQQVKAGSETPYIIELAKRTSGVCEVVLPVGRADVACSTTVFEVEPAETWRYGLRQVLAYAAQTGWKPGLALFGPADYERIYLFLRDRLTEIEVTLWVWRGAWEHTTSRKQAKIQYAPLIDPAAQAAAEATGHRVGESKWLREVRAESPELPYEAACEIADQRRTQHYLCLAAKARTARVALGQIAGDRP